MPRMHVLLLDLIIKLKRGSIGLREDVSRKKRRALASREETMDWIEGINNFGSLN